MEPCTASRMAAVSRTERVTTCSWMSPAYMSPSSGPNDVRARVGFRPTRPHSLAGMRIDPPPSLACATGTIPDATAAAEPPLDPPVECSVFQGFLDAPWASGSHVGTMPSSGVLLLPTNTKPAARYLAARYWSFSAIQPWSL